MYTGQFNTIGGGAVLGATQPSYGVADAPKLGEVPVMLERLSGRISDLDSALMQLEQRLAAVTRGEPATKGANPAPTPSCNTGMGAAIQAYGDRVGEMCDRASALLRLLEI